MLRLIGVGDNVVDCNYTTGIMYPGGNSLNFSVYGRQLGHETAYAGVLGTDIQADMVVHALEDKGIYVSSGSACSSNHPGVSGTLKGIGVKDSLLDSTLRFSFGAFNTEEEVDYCLEVLNELVPMLRRYRRA